MFRPFVMLRPAVALWVMSTLSVPVFAQDTPYDPVIDVPRFERTSESVGQRPTLPTDASLPDEEYVLSPGDLLRVTFGPPQDFVVGLDGSLTFPSFAPLHVSGITLREARSKIRRMVARSFDTTKVFVAVSKPNTFRVWITGEVNHPGAKEVHANLRLSDLIVKADDFTPYAMRSRIRIIHSDSTVTIASLSAYYKDMRTENNPRIRFGDRVIVERMDFDKPFCMVWLGQIYYEGLEDGPSVAELYRRIAGFTHSGFPARVRIARAHKPQIELRPEQFFSYVPSPGDTVLFPTLKDVVMVGGAVDKGGAFPYVPGMKAADYAFLAGVSFATATRSRLIIFQGDKEYTLSEFGNREVLPGDRIFVRRATLYLASDYLAVLGSIASIILSAATLYIATHQ